MNSCTGSSSSSSSSRTGKPLINLGKGVNRPLDEVEQRSGTMPSYRPLDEVEQRSGTMLSYVYLYI
jgi:hypothetical protein